MRMDSAQMGFGWGMRRIRRRRWTPVSVVAATAVTLVAVSLLMALLLAAAMAAVAAGALYAGYRGARQLLRAGPDALPPRPASPSLGTPARGWLPAMPVRRRSGLPREARGLIEMARTADPLDRYLLAVNELDRLSAATLEVDPADLHRRGKLARIDELAEQSYNLYDAVLEIERQVAADRSASHAMPNVWELSVATRELWWYARDVASAGRTAGLSEIRAFVGRRAALLQRRDALVDRLRDAELRR